MTASRVGPARNQQLDLTVANGGGPNRSFGNAGLRLLSDRTFCHSSSKPIAFSTGRKPREIFRLANSVGAASLLMRRTKRGTLAYVVGREKSRDATFFDPRKNEKGGDKYMRAARDWRIGRRDFLQTGALSVRWR
jgi:hypothetical protein